MVMLAFMPTQMHRHHQPTKALPDLKAGQALCTMSDMGQITKSLHMYTASRMTNTVTGWEHQSQFFGPKHELFLAI